MASRIFALLSLALVVGCPADSDEGSTGTEDTWLPDVCSTEASPFTQPECLAAIQDACNARLDEASCSTEPLPYAGFAITCGWAALSGRERPSAAGTAPQ